MDQAGFDEAKELLPPWFTPEMTDGSARFYLSVSCGPPVGWHIDRILRVTAAPDQMVWIEAILGSQSAPLREDGTPIEGARIFINLAHIAMVRVPSRG
jgi:hypothetical protein